MSGDDDGDYIRIGTSCEDVFSLSVTLTSITGAASMFGSVGAPCWLSYKLFGLLVQTDQFELGLPAGAGGAFLPIRDVFRMTSSVEDLATFFSTMGTLEVYLCCPGTVLGVAHVRLGDLLSPTAVADPYFTEAEATGGFMLQPLNPPAVVQAYQQGRLMGVDAMVNGAVSLHREAGRAGRDRPVPRPPVSAAAVGGDTWPRTDARPSDAPATRSDTSAEREAEVLAVIRRLQDTGALGTGAAASAPAPPPAPAAPDVQLLERLLAEAHAAASAKDEELVRLTRQLASAEAGSRGELNALGSRVAGLEAELQTAAATARAKEREAEDAQRRVRDLEAVVARSTQTQSQREADLAAQARAPLLSPACMPACLPACYRYSWLPCLFFPVLPGWASFHCCWCLLGV
jgi:hypothetical protein